MTEKKKSLDELIEEALENAPKIEGYAIKQLCEITETPYGATRIIIENLEVRGTVEQSVFGQEKLYKLKPKCACGKPGEERADNGVPCGIHCDECFNNMVAECRDRSW